MSKNEEEKKNASSVRFGLRLKIIVTFFVISSLVSAFITFSAYQILNKKLFEELQGRVKDIVTLGVKTLDSGALVRLAERLRDTADPTDNTKIAEIQASGDYLLASGELNWIRDIEKDIIRYVYIVAPTDNANLTRYVVDADVLNLLEKQKNGEQIEDAEISQFGSVLDISGFVLAKRAIAEKKVFVDTTYIRDEVYSINSISGYAPILDRSGNIVALLGIDMADSDVRQALREVTLYSTLIAILALLCALISSIILGNLFTRGIIYLERIVRRFGERDFAVRAEVKSLDEIGSLGYSFNFMAQTIEGYSSQLEKLLQAYGRFVPQDFLKLLDKKSVIDMQLGDQVNKHMTVLFSDIRDFTGLSESMTPQQTFSFINSYLSQVGPEIRAHNGFIDKYIGDAIMALFPGTPDDAVQAAIAVQNKVTEYNRGRERAGYNPVRIGIGINTGSLMMGTIGENERMDGTVISDAVNLASRIEGLTKYYGVNLLISEHSLEGLADKNNYLCRYVDRVTVKGKNEAVRLYEIYDSDSDGDIELKKRGAPEYARSLILFYEKKFSEALPVLISLLDEIPGDSLYLMYKKRCEEAIAHGVAENWNGIQVFDFASSSLKCERQFKKHFSRCSVA